MTDHDQDTPAAGWRASRRGLLKAGAAAGTLAATSGIAQSGLFRAKAQSSGTLYARWDEAEQLGEFSAAAAADFRTMTGDFIFNAAGFSWPGSYGSGVHVEVSFSADGANFGSSMVVGAAHDIGRPTRDGRVFSQLIFTDGSQSARYRFLDGNGSPIAISGAQIDYINSTAGPNPGGDVEAASLPALTKPTIISRSGWGCDENLRFDAYGEIWPPEYQKVEHVVIHHQGANASGSDASIVRGIYTYHAFSLMWGDIGYNYLVGRGGAIYEGRIGGENVVGGHAFKYAYGTSGICVVGDYNAESVASAALTGLKKITTWSARNLFPTGTSSFYEVPNLPTICGHRNVSQSDCPGSNLYPYLPEIRTYAAQALGTTDGPDQGSVPEPPDGIYTTGQNVRLTSAQTLREFPSTSSASLGSLASGTYCAIYGLPRVVSGVTWYYVILVDNEGYLRAQNLELAPPGSAPAAAFQVYDMVRTNQFTELRRDPGLPQRVTGSIGSGVTLQITGPSVVATGFRWWPVWSIGTTGGWVTQNVLSSTTNPALHLSTLSGRPNQVITWDIKGFSANATVSIRWDGSTKLTVTANGSGIATGSFTVPVSIGGGHTITAVQASPSRTATAAFEVTPYLKLSTPSGPAGSSVSVMPRGFGPAQTVKVQWKIGSSFEDVGEGVTGSTGAGAIPVTIPANAPANSTIRTISTSGTIDIAFTVTGSVTPTATATASKTATPSQTPTKTNTPTPTQTGTASPTATPLPPDTYPIVASSASSPSFSSTRIHDGFDLPVWKTTASAPPSSAWVRVDLGADKPIAKIRWKLMEAGLAPQLIIYVKTAAAPGWTKLIQRSQGSINSWSATTTTGLTARHIRWWFNNTSGSAQLGGIGEIQISAPSGFISSGESSPTATATETPATETPRATPTGTPEQEPQTATAQPTETPSPTPTAEAPTEEPTETATVESPTESPTETATAESPTETPTAEATAENATEEPSVAPPTATAEPAEAEPYRVARMRRSRNSPDPSPLVDGDVTTAWITNDDEPPVDITVTFDLRKEVSLGRIRWIYAIEGYGDGLQIDVSNDLRNWTTLELPPEAPFGSWTELILASPVSARYVRVIYVNDAGTAQLGGLGEIEFYP